MRAQVISVAVLEEASQVMAGRTCSTVSWEGRRPLGMNSQHLDVKIVGLEPKTIPSIIPSLRGLTVTKW